MFCLTLEQTMADISGRPDRSVSKRVSDAISSFVLIASIPLTFVWVSLLCFAFLSAAVWLFSHVVA